MRKKHIHFVGIKGVGMAPLAIIAKEAGFIVSGCDTPDTYITSEILKHAGIDTQNGFDPSHLKHIDMVITTGAHKGFDNPEVKKAKDMGIPVYTQGEAVGLFMQGNILNRDDLVGISVSGCHGKTTTSALVATLLNAADFDPSFAIGTGMIPSLKSAGHFGMGIYFVAEADEYATEPTHDKTPKFLWQHPKIAVITNIEYDHPDLYASLTDVRLAYEQFAKQVSLDLGLLVVNGDDKQIQLLLENYTGEVITFGFEKENDYVITALDQGKFRLRVDQQDWEDVFTNPVLGLHNIKNATAAIVIARELEIDDKTIRKGLSVFNGTKRRMEYVGQLKNGAFLYDDYAHHPTEIKATMQSIREKYPDKQITVFFQPHTFSRTKLLFEEFVDSFIGVDHVILTDIYPSAREPIDTTISSRMLVEQMQKKQINATYLPTLSDMVQYVKSNTREMNDHCVLVTMGAGDIYTISQELL